MKNNKGRYRKVPAFVVRESALRESGLFQVYLGGSVKGAAIIGIAANIFLKR